MLDMAFCAILEVLPGVQSPFCLYAIPQDCMAIEAFSTADFLPGLVAFLAVPQTFEEGVRFVQVSGGELGRRTGREYGKKY